MNGDSIAEAFLKRYRSAVADQKLIEEQIDQLEAYSASTTRRITGMPRGHKVDLLPSLIDERKRLEAAVEAAQAVKGEVMQLLETLPDDEKRLLVAIFILGKPAEIAARYVPCSERTAYYMKARALRKLDEMIRREPP